MGSAAEHVNSLRRGNARFVKGELEHPQRTNAQLRLQLSEGQAPFAAVLACADSRVPVGIVFDQAPGELFVVRTAGHVAGPVEIGSLEYAAKMLRSTLMVVLGHSDCGAVKATLEWKAGRFSPGSEGLHAVVTGVRRSLPADADPPAMADAVESHVRGTMAVLGESPILGPMASAGMLSIVGAVYDLRSGEVTFLQ